ncbi:carboxymuconolactone decarboxylase family protein [Weissella diestrammenae]|uniref:Carboxymuconolactone decarboxylase family protein n=1 Tax=Weissella diestrammenae TaxID=1162633 RepID=A0A7G9T575_9LACO|nr:carboxymuconolactone decarboxylase family protein [Weissella diestrammenae]MCM0583106.1 carboxymuconolactone decarboxylase family protein [Weissella diestrammenae]QNN75250.1 carboxymuconolactone decarboxylase family protein [Weissella diestrammenae]
MANKITAGADMLGEFAPQFAHLNDDVLFGEVWSQETELSARDRSLMTITALVTQGAFEQLPFHMQKGKENGLKQVEVVAMITQLAFYVGWPKAWSAFNIAKHIYEETENGNK